jgi:hypothetical protein
MIREPTSRLSPMNSSGARSRSRRSGKLCARVLRPAERHQLQSWANGHRQEQPTFEVLSRLPGFKMLPVPFSVSKELGNCRQFTETLLDTFSESLARYPSLEARIHRELQNWKLKRANVSAFSFDREGPQFFLSSGTAILKHAIQDAWKRFVQSTDLTCVA